MLLCVKQPFIELEIMVNAYIEKNKIKKIGEYTIIKVMAKIRDRTNKGGATCLNEVIFQCFLTVFARPSPYLKYCFASFPIDALGKYSTCILSLRYILPPLFIILRFNSASSFKNLFSVKPQIDGIYISGVPSQMKFRITNSKRV